MPKTGLILRFDGPGDGNSALFGRYCWLFLAAELTHRTLMPKMGLILRSDSPGHGNSALLGRYCWLFPAAALAGKDAKQKTPTP